MARSVPFYHTGINHLLLKNILVPDLRVLRTHQKGQSLSIDAHRIAIRLCVRVRRHDVA